MTATSSPCDSTVLSDMYVHPHGVAFSAATTVVLVFPCIWWPTKLKQGVSVKTSLQWVQILGATTPYHPWDWNICLHSYFYHKIQPFRKVKYIYIPFPWMVFDLRFFDLMWRRNCQQFLLKLASSIRDLEWFPKWTRQNMATYHLFSGNMNVSFRGRDTILIVETMMCGMIDSLPYVYFLYHLYLLLQPSFLLWDSLGFNRTTPENWQMDMFFHVLGWFLWKQYMLVNLMTVCGFIYAQFQRCNLAWWIYCFRFLHLFFKMLLPLHEMTLMGFSRLLHHRDILSKTYCFGCCSNCLCFKLVSQPQLVFAEHVLTVTKAQFLCSHVVLCHSQLFYWETTGW